MQGIKISIITIFFIIIAVSTSVYALKIESPKEGEYVYAGSKMMVIVKPDPGEHWKTVSFGFDGMNYDPAKNEYSITVDVPLDYLGYYDNLIVTAADEEGNSIQLKRGINVKMPPDVVLESIMVSKSTMVLFKFPSDSEPENVTRIESRQLHVGGVYSDGVKRSLTSSATGTTYQSSNQDVVTVSPEGLVTAINTGKARITIKNGSFRKEVDVVVKPYK